MRIVSLLPAATEIVGALGMMEQLVGVSHECDYPPEAAGKPRVTRCPIHEAGLSSGEVDRRVREALETTGTLYTLNEPLLRELRPDVILTQKLCDVCAVGYGTVARMAAALPGPPRIVNLEPERLADIFDNLERVAEAVGVPGRAAEVCRALRARVDAVLETVAGVREPRPRCLLLEWIDPPFSAGHWNPELVRLAGGVELLGREGEPSRTLSWGQVTSAAPQVLVLACCGYTTERTLEDLPVLRSYPGFDELPAVRARRVYAANGNAYFARPGPRVVDSLEILAEILHPHLFAGRFPPRGTVRIG